MGKGNHPTTIKPSLDEFDFDFSKTTKTGKQTSKTSSQVEEIFDDIDHLMLDKEFRAKCLHPLSQSLPVNTVTSEKEYEKILEPHNDGRNYKKAKEKGLNDNIELNLGRKLHVNILPENVIVVDQYLNDNGFSYKYLHGGDLIDGKIFTIYVGSYILTKKISKRLFNDIGKYLCKPKAKMDVEFESGIVGRFSENKKPEGRTTYGTCGFPLNYALKKLGERQMELISYRILKEKHGKYFHE